MNAQGLNDTAVIVLHYGDKTNTIECLKSLKNLRNKKNIKFFIVDNGAKNLNRQEILSILPQSTLIESKNNLGYSGGNNLAIKEALKNKFKFILLLNNDTVISSNAIEEFKKPFKEDPSIGITGCLITYYKYPQKIWFAGGHLNKFFCYTLHPSINKSLNNSPKSRNVDFVTGAAMLIKSQVFEDIGLLDEDYFLYWEDVDFCERAKNKGYKCYYINKLLVKHKVSSSSGTKGNNNLSPIRAYYYARNPFLFMQRNDLKTITAISGQFFIRFPYYLLHLQNFTSFKWYVRGLIEGIRLS